MTDEQKRIIDTSSINLKNELITIFGKEKKFTFIDSLEDRANDILFKAKDSVINDSYGNSLLSIGNNDNTTQCFTNYTFNNDSLNWPLWLALYNDSWVFKRAIDKPAIDQMRATINIETEFEEKKDILRICKQHTKDFTEILQWGSLFGGSIGVCLFDTLTDEDYSIPINDEKINKKILNAKSLKLYVVDRWYGVAPSYDDIVDDMNSLDYGKPKYYRVTYANGHTVNIHHDYILRYEHRIAPKLVKNGMLQGWGYSEGSHILNELMRDEKLKTSIQSLIDKSLLEIIKMSGMKGIFLGQDKENEYQLQKRLEMVNWGRNFNSLTFLDSQDEYSMNEFHGLSGLSDLLEKNMWQIAAALEMQGVLFGDLKNGFSTDIDALERYDEIINGRCETYLRPVYEKFLWIVFKWKNIKEKIEFSFNSLLIRKQDEDKIKGLKDFTDLCSQLLSDGVITTEQYAKAFRNYTIKGVIDFEITDEVLENIKAENKISFEGINLDENY